MIVWQFTFSKHFIFLVKSNPKIPKQESVFCWAVLYKWGHAITDYVPVHRGKIYHFLSGPETKVAMVNPPDEKLVNPTSVQWDKYLWDGDFNGSNQAEIFRKT